MNVAILIVDRNPRWPAFLEQGKEILISLLKNQLAEIKHTGSTAVPGLAAKPIIDIMLGLRQDVRLDACIKPLKQRGYVYIYPNMNPSSPFDDTLRRDQRRLTDNILIHIICMLST